MPETSTTEIGWKQFAVRVIDVVRWPVAIVVIVALQRQPFGNLISAMARALGG